jgi:hypothetical protein
VSNIFLDQIINDNLAAVHSSQSITSLGGAKPSSKGPVQRSQTKKKQNGNGNFTTEGLGAPVSFFPRAARDEGGRLWSEEYLLAGIMSIAWSRI